MSQGGTGSRLSHCCWFPHAARSAFEAGLQQVKACPQLSSSAPSQCPLGATASALGLPSALPMLSQAQPRPRVSSPSHPCLGERVTGRGAASSCQAPGATMWRRQAVLLHGRTVHSTCLEAGENPEAWTPCSDKPPLPSEIAPRSPSSPFPLLWACTAPAPTLLTHWAAPVCAFIFDLPGFLLNTPLLPRVTVRAHTILPPTKPRPPRPLPHPPTANAACLQLRSPLNLQQLHLEDQCCTTWRRAGQSQRGIMQSCPTPPPPKQEPPSHSAHQGPYVAVGEGSRGGPHCPMAR